ncbi:unnamed protein product [Heterosigma akashiwo]|uniref:Plastid lipid-associated protein/fibrillin conserved domain-containing protein n=1 Tax=Heterosigma akashiwo TaxID=2829 RepID=A0A6T5NYX6_HETAK
MKLVEPCFAPRLILLLFCSGCLFWGNAFKSECNQKQQCQRATRWPLTESKPLCHAIIEKKDLNDGSAQEIHLQQHRGRVLRQRLAICHLAFFSFFSGMPSFAATNPYTSGVPLNQIEVKSYQQQLREATPLSTIRGTWRLREFRPAREGGLCRGTVLFRGFEDEPKGTLEYAAAPGGGCEGRAGKGNWLVKPGRVSNGQIILSARWKIKFNDGTTLIYKGDVDVTGRLRDRPDASIDGEILIPVKTQAGSLSEKNSGLKFQADYLKVGSDSEKL